MALGRMLGQVAQEGARLGHGQPRIVPACEARNSDLRPYRMGAHQPLADRLERGLLLLGRTAKPSSCASDSVCSQTGLDLGLGLVVSAS